jgi:biopolymer transport protein ExbB
MNILSGALCVFGLMLGSAQQSAADQTLSHVSSSAEQELAKSVQALNQLREQIAAEKLPLAQELTNLEEKLSQLRRESDRVTRLVDSSNLEISTIKGEMKVRQDELSYLGNLLDEYARTFESKVNISELQYCGEAIETAKQATENTTLSMPEKFARQTALVEVTVKRLFDAIGGLRFPGTGVDLQGAVASGQFAIIGPVALFRGNGGGATGLVVAQSGSTKPLIRALEGPLQAGIASLVDTGEGLLPLDPSRGGALKALVQKTNIVHIFQKGGPIMWPLLLASILALGTVLERLIFLMGERLKRDPETLDKFFAAVTRGDTDGAILISKTSKFYVVRALGYALTHKEQSLANALLYAQAQELKRFRRGIPILDTVITLAPLLGLLGTVTGMMGSFSLIGGDLSAPGAITGGIAEALIATAFGLGIAITALLPFNFLNARMDEARHEIESAATQLELLVRPAPVATAAQAPAGETKQVEVVVSRGPDGMRREIHHARADGEAAKHAESVRNS